MNINMTSQYTDKQIMDLSNSQTPIGNNDFIDFMNRPAERKNDIVPNYDFMPIRPSLGSSSPMADRSSDLDAGNDDASLRTWNSVDSNTSASPVRNYSSPVAVAVAVADESANFVLGRTHKSSDVSLDASLVSEIDKTMKKYMDNLKHVVDKMSARLSQLESRTHNLENSFDDLKVIIGNNHGRTDGKMRSLENILTEVLAGIHFIQDKHEIIEAELKIAKLQIPKAEQGENHNTADPAHTQTGLPTHHPPAVAHPPLPQPPPTLPPLNTPPPPPQHSIQPQVQQLSNHFLHSQGTSVPQQEPYLPHSSPNPENPRQQYQAPPPYPTQPSSQTQYSQPPPQHSQPHPSISTAPQQPVAHHPEETPYMPSAQAYSLGIRPSFVAPPPPPQAQQYYGPNPTVYDPSSNRVGLDPGYSSSFGPYPYSGSSIMSQQNSSPGVGQSGYPQLPTARILPQALPTASAMSGPGSGSDNRVPIDDVVDRVTNMGFPRDQVRATVRKLTENGQAVDLNVVLDKLMNGGDGQAQRGWFGR